MSYPEKRMKRTRKAKFEIDKNRDREFIWRFKATSGEIIASGESYKNKADCKRAIEMLKREAADADVLDKTISVAAVVSKR
jgi:uncharacterized protein